jgi:hypothetical protein
VCNYKSKNTYTDIDTAESVLLHENNNGKKALEFLFVKNVKLDPPGIILTFN